MSYRQIFVWSEAKAAQEAKTRQRHLEKTRAEFEAIEKNLDKYSLKTRDKIVSRLESAKGKYAVGDAFTYELSQRVGKFSLSWAVDQALLNRLTKLEGAYVLKTDLQKSKYSASAVLQEYKEQIHVERRIGDRWYSACHYEITGTKKTSVFVDFLRRLMGAKGFLNYGDGRASGGPDLIARRQCSSVSCK